MYAFVQPFLPLPLPTRKPPNLRAFMVADILLRTSSDTLWPFIILRKAEVSIPIRERTHGFQDRICSRANSLSKTLHKHSYLLMRPSS